MEELAKRQPVSRSKSSTKTPEPALLFRCQNNYFIRADRNAIPLTDAGCFVEAVDFLFMSFHVFNVHYPFKIRYLYGFIEKMLVMPSSVGKSTVIDSLYRRINQVENTV
jgi:hypothetical protein